ncbi:MAG: pyridoxal phosphate-dependent aminotransferase [Bdellovibrionales bacterium]|nr:pyridoxal phosphate-dependent aminotransferase [Bdellovibrionales bacterium]
MNVRSFSKRVRSIQVSAIKQMPIKAADVPGAISLGQGIPSVKTPGYIRRKIAELLERDEKLGMYSLQPGVPALREAIAAEISARVGRPVSWKEEVFISAGAMEALFTAMVSIIEEEDEVILFDPCYASHIEQVLFAGGTPVFVHLEEGEGWNLPIEKLKTSISPKTKAIVVCNPANPTGTVFSKDELGAIAELVQNHGLYLIADETYDFLVYDDVNFTSLSEFKNIKEQVILCNSFSKRFAMTGFRVGYMYAPSAVIEQALKVHDAAVIAAPTISQYAALAALTETPGEDSVNIHQLLLKRRDLLCSRLESLSSRFSFVKPQGAYYVMVRYHDSDRSAIEYADDLLYSAKVITIPGSAFGPAGEHHIRMSFGGSEDDIHKAFDQIERWSPHE